MKKYFPLVFCLSVIVLLGSGVFTRTWSDPDSESAAAVETTPRLLHIAAMVDGSGRFIFTRNAVRYEHKHWSPPKNVIFDNESWENLSLTPAAWRQIAASFDISKAHIVKRSGRDVVALEQTAEGFDLYFCDSPNGAARYEVLISIPPRS